MFTPNISTVTVSSLDDPVNLYFVSDLHLMEKGCDIELLRKHVSIIKNDPYALVVLGGDNGSYICKNDKRLDFSTFSSVVTMENFADWGNFLVESTVNELWDIKDKIIVSIMGNHEHSYKKSHQHDVHQEFCDRLDVFNGGYTSMFIIQFKEKNRIENKKKLVVYATHGSGGSTTKSGKMRKLRNVGAQAINADLVLVGHMHDQIECKERYFYYRDGVKSHYKTCVCPGSYLESYSDDSTLYGELKSYNPPILGCAKIQIIPKTKEIQVIWMN